ncbi:MAG: class I SAM-dependent methyltransferase [Oscillospiraceae bacterium]|nr:class I SAM-dependent methyltransferase [Oscillospiraceae bacterium]
MNEDYTDINAKTIDKWVEGGWEWGIPISHEEYENAKRGQWDMLLSPIKPVPKSWFLPFLKNSKFLDVKILGLASGGGQQMPIFAGLGAIATVFDYSDKQLESEKMVSLREGYHIDIVKGDMTKRLPFLDQAFDIIFHPVSNCYVEDVFHVWNECFRVLKHGGILLAGMDNGVNFLFDDVEKQPLVLTNKLPYNPLKDEALLNKLAERDDGIQFSHTLEEQIGGQLKAGFILTDLYEDKDKGSILAEYISQYIVTRAVKP